MSILPGARRCLPEAGRGSGRGEARADPPLGGAPRRGLRTREKVEENRPFCEIIFRSSSGPPRAASAAILMTETSSRKVLRIQDMPSEDRPRERLSRVGASALSNEELLALLIGSGTRGESALDRARRLLAEHGGLAGLASLTPSELSSEKGIKGARGSVIVAALEVARRLAVESLTGRDLFNEPGLVKDYLRRARGDGTQERTGALYLNARNRLLKDDAEIYRGTLDRAVVEPREILKRAVLANAAGIIVYHNHPSGDPSPSREDREFTRRLASAADVVGLRLLDHIVVGREGCVSFREAGLL